ncbi:MAG: peptidylprolyl isomerase [Candidatus Saccharimonadales bacterium]
MKKRKLPLKAITGLPKKMLPKRLHRNTREERATEAFSSIPQITNETVAEHREEVLSSARKYIYPLQHSKYRIVIVSTALFITAVLVFFVYCGLALYRFQSTSAFLYRVTQVLPFPVAKAGPSFVAYENYLFELRRYIHYYQTQQQVDFNGKGKSQLAAYKPKAMQQVIDVAYVKQLAAKHHVSVSSGEINDELDLLRRQNQLGTNNDNLANVVKEFFGWSIDDLKRELQQELLAQKVVAKLDTATQDRAVAAEKQLASGVDFATLAGQISDDAATKANGGQYANQALTVASTDVSPRVLKALIVMQAGQVSTPINTGTGLEIVKVLAVDGDKIKAAHIYFQYKNISTYLDPLKKAHPTHSYISVK